jgi:hypothetical protein
LLSYISLFAYQYLLPGPMFINDEEVTQDIAWVTFNNILSWKLESSSPASFKITELDIIHSLKAHLTPFIMPSLGDGGAEAKQVWDENSKRLMKIHSYWLHRGIEVFALSDLATATIGTPENHKMNQVAYIRAMGTKLQLTEAYGLSDKVVTDSGLNGFLNSV